MQNTTSNTNPGMDSSDWAKRFVPLPPTEFPSEATAQSSGSQAVERNVNNLLDRLDAQANLPCLHAIAGVDPFFYPEETSSAAGEQPEKPVTNNPSSLSTSEPPTAGPLRPVVNSSNPSQTNNDIVHSPSVEVIGQQTQQTPITPQKNLAAETPLHEEKPEVNLMNNASPEKPSPEKPIVEIHEYDLAMKVLPNVDVVGTNTSQATENVAANEPASDDIANYWSQDNVSCFIPGVTPIEAYPVCQEYVDQISVSCDARLTSPTDDTPEQASQTEQPCQSEQVQPEEQAETDTDGACNVGEFTPVQELPTAEETNTAFECSPEPTQIDPFENDEFDSVQHVTPVKSGNQSLQITSTPLTAAACPSEVETPQTNEPADINATDSTSLEVPTEPVEPQVEPIPEVSNVATTPLDVTQTIPQLPNNVTSAQPGSHQLFESVEQSLNELQSINQLESNATFAPATNALFDSPTQPQQANSSPVEAPASVESVEVDEPVSTAVPSVEEIAAIEQPAMPSAPVEQPVPTEMSNLAEPTAPAPLAAPPIQIENPGALATSTVAEESSMQQVPVSEERLTDASAAVENPAPADVPASLVASALASLSPPPQPDVQAFHPVDVTAQLPAVPTGTMPAPPEAPTETSIDTPEMPAALAEQTPVATEAPVELPANSPEPAPSEETPTAAATESNCQVVEVDGNDGYDFLDLKAFDVANAIFTPGIIFLDDGENRFQIQYRNLNLAVFADDFQVELT